MAEVIFRRACFLATMLGLVCTLCACDTLIRYPGKVVGHVGANMALRFTEQNLVPPMLANDDVRMACTNGESTTPLLLATGDGLGADNDLLASLLYTTASICAEDRAVDEELRYMRALRANAVDEAKDARMAQKRWAALAAQRQYLAYQRFEAHFQQRDHIRLGETCPTFRGDFDEMAFMLGLLSGLQAVLNDTAAQGEVGVPKDIAAKVNRSMVCLDNEKWFGVPLAARAAVWSLLPGSGAGQDPWEALHLSMRIGERHGVRLSHAIYAVVAYSKADEARLRDALVAYAATTEDFKVNQKFRLFDGMGGLVLLHVSDRYWTEHTGTRTPAGSLGKFWDDAAQKQDAGVKIDDLL